MPKWVTSGVHWLPTKHVTLLQVIYRQCCPPPHLIPSFVLYIIFCPYPQNYQASNDSACYLHHLLQQRAVCSSPIKSKYEDHRILKIYWYFPKHLLLIGLCGSERFSDII